MPSTNATGVSIHWDESGSGTPVLLIMGHSYTSATWWPVVPELAAQHRVLTFDNRGVGQSGTAPSWTIQDMVADCVAVLDAAGAQDAHVYGVSMGGGIALEMAMSYPSRVRSVVLGCTMAKTKVIPGPSLKQKALLRAIPTRVLLRGSGKGLYGDTAAADRAAHDLEILRGSRIPKSGVLRQSEAVAAYATTEERVRGVTVPALVLHGTLDPAVPYAEGKKLAELVPNARLVTFEGARHNYLIDHGPAANRAVLDFFAEVDATERARAAV